MVKILNFTNRGNVGIRLLLVSMTTLPIYSSQDFSGRTATVVQAQVPLPAQLNPAPDPASNTAGFQPKSSTGVTTRIEEKRLATSTNESANGVATDKYGNIYIAGYTYGGLNGNNKGGSDAFVAKYNSAGNLLWTRQLGTPANDSATGVVSDKYGNVYITGFTSGNLLGTNKGGSDAFVAKYNSGGNLLWRRQLGTSADDAAYEVTSDPYGLVYITGKTNGNLNGTNQGDSDAFVAKYNSGGTLLWARQLGTAAYDSANGVVADKYGLIYMTGSTTGALSGINKGTYDAFVAKYNSAGTLLWTKQLGTSAIDIAYGVASDPNGLIYIAGNTYGHLNGTNKGGIDVFVAKYNSGGTRLWTQQLGTSASDFASGIASDPNGLIYIAGNTYGHLNGTNKGGSDAFVTKYDSGGTRLWTRQLGTPAYDAAYGVTSDPYGLVYITGSTFGNLASTNQGSSDTFVTKYNSGGTRLWTKQ
uniref:Hemolysin-type calcium-binding region n=1 Tax=Cyanothece sp. (strain PCC 7425 / ATCC 29141) TaxID=395961 RepID=B8HS32_CYAP4